MVFDVCFFMRLLVVGLRMLMLISLFMECSCMAPLTQVVIVMRGLTSPPLFRRVFISGLYLVCLCLMVCY